MGSTVEPPRIRHFRDEAKRYVFEALIPGNPNDAEAAAKLQLFLLAFESMFRLLGDMDTDMDGQSEG
jgi:hypothetical protein